MADSKWGGIHEFAELIWQHSIAFRRDLAVDTIEAELRRRIEPLLELASDILCNVRDRAPEKIKLIKELDKWRK